MVSLLGQDIAKMKLIFIHKLTPVPCHLLSHLDVGFPLWARQSRRSIKLTVWKQRLIVVSRARSIEYSPVLNKTVVQVYPIMQTGRPRPVYKGEEQSRPNVELGQKGFGAPST